MRSFRDRAIFPVYSHLSLLGRAGQRRSYKTWSAVAVTQESGLSLVSSQRP